MIPLLISILIFLLIAGIVLWIVSLIVGYLPIPAPIRNLILACVALLLLLVFLQRVGLL